jgi:hypothetical protein
MYGLVFKPVAFIKLRKNPHDLVRLPYSEFQGKIIRNINVLTLDPFGYSAQDTAAGPQNMALEAGNRLHVKTQVFTIKNILLIRGNQPFDSLRVNESERLIRSQSYVADVSFDVVPVAGSKDSLDIHVRVLDKWSFIPAADASTARLTVGFTENDFAGFGHEFQNAYTWNRSNGKNAVATNYSIPDIRNSYLSTALHYNIDEHGDFSEAIAIDRPFFSPLARWAAGMIVARQFQKDSFPDPVLGSMMQDLRFTTQDYWAGTATRILKGNTEEERMTKGVIAGRYLRVRYYEKPDELHDSLHEYADEDFCMAGVGISTRTYFRDNYIFNFGVTEDVPVGRVLGIIGGYQVRDNVGRPYLGARASYGTYYAWGYFSPTAEYGTFFHGPYLEQGVVTLGANYFSNLSEIGSWKIRQFIKPQVTWGLKRFSYDSLTINNENGIRGFSGSSRGTKKIVLTIQTQSYAPWKVFGFRFGPFLLCSFGILGNESSGFKNSPLFSQLGIGTLIRNDHLVLSDFQLSVAYYPSIPGSGFNIFKANAFVTTDFGFRDFDFGKPEIVAFQ